MPTIVASSTMRLDVFLSQEFPEHSRSRWGAWIESGHVKVEGKFERKSGYKLKPGWTIEFDAMEEKPAHDLTPAEIPLEILFEDEYFIVVSKPRGMATHPAPSLKEATLVNALLARGGNLSKGAADFRPGIVHRLDKDTTGAIVVAKSDAAHARLAKQIEQKIAQRIYLALVAKMPDPLNFTIDAPLGRDPRNRLKMSVRPDGKPSITHVAFIERRNHGVLLQVSLETGRTHQIRVHLSSVGLPVIGDPIYAPKALQIAPLQLHAWKLRLEHPFTGQQMEFTAPLPPDFLD